MSEIVDKPKSRRALVDNFSIFLNKLMLIVLAVIVFLMLVVYLLNTFTFNNVTYSTTSSDEYILTNNALFKSDDSDITFKVKKDNFVGCVVLANTEDILALIETQKFTSLNKLSNNNEIESSNHTPTKQTTDETNPDNIFCTSDMMKISNSNNKSPSLKVSHDDLKNASFAIYNPTLSDLKIEIESDFGIDNNVYSLIGVIGLFVILILLLLKFIFRKNKPETDEPSIEKLKRHIRNFNKHEVHGKKITEKLEPDDDVKIQKRGKRRK